MRVDVYVRLAGHKLIRKIYDDSISDMMFVFCHHRSHTHLHNYQILCDPPLQFQFFIAYFIIPTSIAIQKSFGLPILSDKRDDDIQID